MASVHEPRGEERARGDRVGTVTLDIRAPEFWDPVRVETELRRVYDICNGCRRCITLCPSFKDLFTSLDD